MISFDISPSFKVNLINKFGKPSSDKVALLLKSHCMVYKVLFHTLEKGTLFISIIYFFLSMRIKRFNSAYLEINKDQQQPNLQIHVLADHWIVMHVQIFLFILFFS